MSEGDLRALFQTNDAALVARRAFTDRDQEWEAFRSGLRSHISRRRTESFDVQDLVSPRRNVLVYYGAGGIGKSTLLQAIGRHLEPNSDLHWSGLGEPPEKIVCTHVDLARDGGVTYEDIVLAIRIGLASAGIPAPTFDLAFLRYWEKTHPGDPFADYLRRNTFLRKFRGSDSLPESMRTAVADAAEELRLPGALGALAGQTLQLIFRAVREHHARGRAISGCRRFPSLFEAEADRESLTFYPHLLSWDLERRAHRDTTLVVLLDTLEDLDGRRRDDMERAIQRLIWLTPNVFYVLAGRRKIDWDNPNLPDELDWLGRECWPTLSPDGQSGSAQHLVGFLAGNESLDYLRNRLTHDGQPAIPEQIRSTMARRSRGLPLYLDLAVSRFITLRQRGATHPTPDDFDHDFPVLAERLLRDLTAEERHVVRAMSLMDSFSVDIAREATGLRLDAAVIRLIERPFFVQPSTGPLPYRLQPLVRDTMRRADHGLTDRWSPHDWTVAAERAITALTKAATPNHGRPDHRALINALQQGLRLARDFGIDPSIMDPAVFSFVKAAIADPIELDAHSLYLADLSDEQRRSKGRPAIDLANLLTIVSGRQRRHRNETLRLLLEIRSRGFLPEIYQEIIDFFVAQCQRNIGELDESLAGMENVAARGGHLAQDAIRGVAHLSRRSGRFREGMVAIERLNVSGHRDRVLGELFWTQGFMELSAEAFRRGRDGATELGWLAEAAENQSGLALAAAWSDRSWAASEIGRAREMLTGQPARWAELQTSIAELVANAGGRAVPRLAAFAFDDASEAGMTSAGAYVRLAECFHAVLLDDDEAIAAARTRLSDLMHGLEFMYLVEITYMWRGEELPAGVESADWLDRERTASSWRRLYEDRAAQYRDRTT